MPHSEIEIGARTSGDVTHTSREPERKHQSSDLSPSPPAIIQGAGDGAKTVREDAEGSLHFLSCTSFKPAVLLARAWSVSGIPFAFKHLALYREVAAASHCSLVEIVRQEAGGLEHLVFAARIRGLTDEEYLACIEEGPESRT